MSSASNANAHAGTSTDGAAPSTAESAADTDLRSIVDALPETLVRYDRDGRITFVNDEFRRRTGRTLAEVAGRRPFEWADEQHLVDDIDEYRQMLDRTITTGEPCDMLRSRDHGDGTIEFYQVFFRPDVGADGAVHGAFAMARNVTDLLRARREVGAREREFRTLAENLPDLLIRYDADARARYVNRPADLGMEVDTSQLIGTTPTEYAPDDPQMATYERSLRHVLATGEPATVDMVFTDRDGVDHVHSVLFSAERSEAGAIVGAIAFGRDVTELAAAHREIADRERQFRTLAENLPEVLVRYDREGRAVYANEEFQRQVGGPSVVGRTPDELPSRSRPFGAYRELLMRVLATGEPGRIELSPLGPDGDPRYQSVLVEPEFDADGEVCGAIAIGRDVTDLVRARHEAAEREHQFRSLAENIPQVLIRYDATGTAIYANNQFERQVGASPLVGQPLEAFRPQRPGVGFRDRLRQVLATGEPDQIEIPVTAPDGAERVHIISMQPEFGPDGHIVGAITIGHDVTDLIRTQRELAAREREFRSLAENLPDTVIRYDMDARATYVNRLLDLASGPRWSDLIGSTPLESGPATMPRLAEYEQTLRTVLATGRPGSIEMRFTDAEGVERAHSVLMSPECDDDGTVTGAIAIGRDVTELVRAQQAVAGRERQFRTLAENATDFIGRWSTGGVRSYVNPALAQLLDAAPDELLGTPFSGDPTSPFADTTDAILRCLDDGVQRTVQQRHVDPLDGERIHEVRLVPEFGADGSVESVLGIGRDITEVVRQREALERSSRTDPLTGMSSRQVLYEQLPPMLVRRQAAGGRLALLLVDLDGFKHINDQYGHRLGDRILRHVGSKLTGCMGEGDLLVRLGGDEFVFVIAEVDSPTDASLLAHQARMQLADIDIDGDVRFPALDASVGIAIFPDDGTDADVLLAHADLALYDAKRAGRGRVEFFRHELRAAMERRSSIEQALRDCVPDTQMALHMQPICTLDPEPRVWGAEALLRWHHPVLGTVTPDEFIPIAEQSGQIVPIGRWVLRRAAELAVQLNADRAEPLEITVNVSTRQFTLDDIGDAVRAALGSAGCDPSWIVLELTESLLLEDVPLVHRALEQLRALGVRVAIDDFGTGYSALHYLTKLRIDHMKIDKTFVRDADVDHQQQEIVRALVAMASALGIGIVAEGIETCGQAEFLRSLGCHLGQGYLLARPMPFDGFREWLDTSAATLRAALPV